MMIAPGIIRPQWKLPPQVAALYTTRVGGVSLAPCDSFNLGTHVGDDAAAVAANRARLCAHVGAEPLWLEQVHGIAVADADRATGKVCADAAVAREPQRACVVLTADCLPVLLCDDAGTVVAAAHAGWRGLAAGVLEASIARMEVAPHRLSAWLGPAIGASAFEVGADVRDAFMDEDADAATAFVSARPGKWVADLHALARRRLVRCGVVRISAVDACTFSDPTRYFSYRRDDRCGRQAALIWLRG